MSQVLYAAVLLAQFSNCASVFCSLPFEEEFAVQRPGIFVRDAEDMLALGEGEFILVSRDPGATGAVSITRVTPDAEVTIASIPPLFPHDAARSLIGGEGGWWFARSGVERMEQRVFFVTASEQIRSKKVDVALRFSDVWLPLRGEKPRGLLASVSYEDSELIVESVSPEGVETLARFPMASVEYDLLDATWSAEELSDGRYAIVSVDNPADNAPPRLRIVGGPNAGESTFDCETPIRLTVATAIGTGSTLAVVGLSNDSEVVAALLDVEHPQSATCRVVSSPGEVAAYALSGTPSVVFAGDRFIAAWIREDGMVRACEFTDLGTAPVVIDIGQDAAVTRPLRQLVHADDESLTFLWKDRWHDLVMRRMPKEITQLEAAVTLRRYLCAAAGLPPLR